MKTIVVNTRGLNKRECPHGYILVDDEDYELVSQYKWSAPYTCNGQFLYAQTKINGKYVMMHHAIIGMSTEGLVVDHINGNKIDNRRCNLRYATRSQNAANSIRNIKAYPSKVSKYTGVRNYFGDITACVRFNGKVIRLGKFKTEEEAAKAYDDKAFELWGEFAKLNFSR